MLKKYFFKSIAYVILFHIFDTVIENKSTLKIFRNGKKNDCYNAR